MFNKKFSVINLVMISFFIMFVSVGCDNPLSSNDSSSSNDNLIGNLQRVDNTGVKSLFVSDYKDGSVSSRSIDTGDLSLLTYINSSNQEEPLTFTTDDGKKVVINITNTKKMTDEIIAVYFNAIIEVKVETDGITTIDSKSVNKKALLKMSTGDIYDLSNYDLLNSIIDNNILYTLSGDTVYKIDLSNISNAIPLNNGDINPVTEILFVTNNDKLITKNFNAPHYSLDINGTIPPKVISSETITAYGLSEEISILDAQFQDSNGDYYVHEIRGFNTPGSNEYYTCKISIDDDGNTIVSDYYEGNLTFQPNSTSYEGSAPLYHYKYEISEYNVFNLETIAQAKNEIVYIFKEGTVRVSLDSSGSGIQVESNQISFPFIEENTDYYSSCPRLIGNTLYRMAGTDIIAVDISTGNADTLYSNSDIVNPVKDDDDNYINFLISNNNFIFYKYITAVDIGTFSLEIGQSEPTMINENKTNVRNIMELSF